MLKSTRLQLGKTKTKKSIGGMNGGTALLVLHNLHLNVFRASLIPRPSSAPVIDSCSVQKHAEVLQATKNERPGDEVT